MKKALVTGICGFVGRHLSELLIKKGYMVYGIYQLPADIDLLPSQMKEQLTLFECDITESEKIRQIFLSHDFDLVFHLAGIAHVPFAEKNLETAFSVNVIGTGNILNALKEKPNCQMIYVSSSEVYAPMPEEKMPYTESHLVSPSNIYGITKYSAEMLCSLYSKKWDLKIIIFRPFNHIGPYQSPLFVAQEFARKIALIEKGQNEPEIKVGNLEVMRDFSDVRDIVEGYVLAAECIHNSELFNICSGNAIKIRELLDQLLSISTIKIKVTVDETKFRKNDNLLLKGSYRKLNKLTGWEPKIPLSKSLTDILNYWRQNI